MAIGLSYNSISLVVVNRSINGPSADGGGGTGGSPGTGAVEGVIQTVAELETFQTTYNMTGTNLWVYRTESLQNISAFEAKMAGGTLFSADLLAYHNQFQSPYYFQTVLQYDGFIIKAGLTDIQGQAIRDANGWTTDLQFQTAMDGAGVEKSLFLEPL